MPSKTKKQAKFMAACAHGADYPSCPPKKVAKDFNKHDKKTGILKKEDANYKPTFLQWLNEIVRVAPLSNVGFDLSDFNWDLKKLSGKAKDNYQIYEIPTKFSNQTMFAILVDDKPISLLVGTKANIGGQDYFVEQRTFTEPEFRKQGLSASIFYHVIRNLNLPVISDFEHTKDNELLWKSLMKRFKVKAYDNSENKIIDEVPEEFYVDFHNQHRYMIILENTNGIPNVPLGVLEPMGI